MFPLLIPFTHLKTSIILISSIAQLSLTKPGSYDLTVTQTKTLKALTHDFADVEDIMSVDKNIGLEINSEDVEELVKDHKNEISLEKQEQLQEQQQKMIVEEMSSEEEEGREDVPSSLICKICAKWGEAQSFVEPR